MNRQTVVQGETCLSKHYTTGGNERGDREKGRDQDEKLQGGVKTCSISSEEGDRRRETTGFVTICCRANRTDSLLLCLPFVWFSYYGFVRPGWLFFLISLRCEGWKNTSSAYVYPLPLCRGRVRWLGSSLQTTAGREINRNTHFTSQQGATSLTSRPPRHTYLTRVSWKFWTFPWVLSWPWW